MNGDCKWMEENSASKENGAGTSDVYRIDIIESGKTVKTLYPHDRLEANRLFYHWSGIHRDRCVRLYVDGIELGYAAARAYLGKPQRPIGILYA